MSNANRRALLALSVPALAVQAVAQQFVRNTTNVPANAGNYTEDVDFVDVDDDGDWDAAFANGGDIAQLQNTLWINQGFAQGGTLGTFLDATTARCPAILDQSREIEFADIDGDGDEDAHVSNHAQFVNQGNRWWVNQGGLQGGSIGFFADDTAARWVGLGGTGSSIAPSQVLPGGTFLDFCFDSEFADWDNDGDLDLVHSSCGSAIAGNIPTRHFLNDGGGHFAEFNPSGVQLTGQTIANGTAGLWCAGNQTANTADSTGAACDIAASTIDVDVGDVDGDLDLDILLGSLQELPRLFQNRTQENGGVLGWRDVTGASFAAGSSSGVGHYAQEFGDLDSDADLDLYGVNWLVFAGFRDATYLNDGAGHFGSPSTILSSEPDENEVDWIDHDLDGDLDAILANFSGQEALCRNDGVFPLVRLTSPLPTDGTNSLDVDVADVDGDGDFDAFIANGNSGMGSNEWFLQNTTLSNDITPPSLSHLEQAPNRTVGAAPTVVRLHVNDNAPAYVTKRANAWLELRVNGGPTFPVPLSWSGAQVFRGAIPGSLVGLASYRAIVIDEHGNTASTLERNYVATNPGTGASFCLGDGTQTLCPCGNTGSVGNGCANSSNPAGALLVVTGSTALDSIVLSATGMPATVSAIYLKGDAGLSTGVLFGDGVRCVDGALIRLRTKQNVAGASQFPDSTDTLTVGVRGSTPPGSGLVGYYQTYYRNAAAAFCPPATFNVTNGVILVW